MALILLFALLGAFVGYAAARTNGYDVVLGLLGGALLGILSPLMFVFGGKGRAKP